MKRAFDTPVIVGIGLLVALLVINAGLAYRNTLQLRDDARWVAHSHEVLDLTGNVLIALVDAETGQRGFLITGKDEFLQPYDAALARVDNLLSALKQQTTDNAAQQIRVKTLQEMSAVRLAILKQGIDLRRRSADEATAFIVAGKDKAQMDAIRQHVKEMEQVESDLLKNRENDSDTAYRVAVLTGLLAAVLGLVTVGAFVRLLDRSLRTRQEAAAVISEQKERLRTTLASIGDAVISTDIEGRISNMNAVAESLTGWTSAAVMGQPLDAVFRILNEETRQTVENPATRAVREGVIVGLANHTILIAKDGTERAIDDSAGPIRCAMGEVVGCVLVFRDVAEQRSIQRKLRERDTFVNGLLGSITDAFMAVDRDWCFTFVNGEFLQRAGKDVSEVLGKNMWDMFPDAVGNEAHAQLHRAMVDRVSVEYEVFYAPWQSWLLAKAYPTADGGLAIYSRDITDRKLGEDQLLRSQETFFNLIEQAPFGVYVVDAQFRLQQVNSSAQAVFSNVRPLLGRYFDEAIRIIWRDPLASEILAQFHHTLQTGEPYLAPSLTAMREDVEAIESYEWQIQRVTLPDGQHGVVCYFFDTTNLRRVEKALSESEERFRDLADNIPQLAWIADAGTEGQIHWFNQNWFAYTGTTLEQMKGSGWHAVHHPDHAERVIQKFSHHVQAGLDWEDTFPLRGKDGQYRWFLSRMKCIRDDSGAVVRIFGTNTDVTEQRQMADQLQQNASDMAEADRRKNEFLAMLAHELRNPLSPIRNAVQVLRVSGSNEQSLQSTTQMMERQVGQLVRLVDDLLDVSRISRGKIDLRKGQIELASAVHHAVEAVRANFESMDQDLTVTMPSEPVYLNADPARLAQIVGNLLSNACKFTDQGGRIWLTVETEDKYAVIRVRDEGIGMAAEQIHRIFEMFTQLDTSLERSRGGLGIGLTLVKNLVEMHGGTVEAHSTGIGQGSEFVVHLPVLAATPESQPPQQAAAGKPPPTAARRILVVDDNQDAALSLAMLLKLTGHETHTAGDGIEAVEAAQTFRPDVILLDIGLPRLNGYDAARRIREQPWGKNMVLVALTGWGQEEDRRKSREAGFDGHLVKPVDLTVLEKMLSSFSGEERGS